MEHYCVLKQEEYILRNCCRKLTFFFLKREKLINDEHDKISYNDCWKLSFYGQVFTFFDKLHKHWVVTADSEPKAIFIFLDYYTSLDQTCQSERENTPIKIVLK